MPSLRPIAHPSHIMPESSRFALAHAINKTPPCSTPDTPISHVLRQMQTAVSSHSLVTDARQVLISLVTERDLVSAIAAQAIALEDPISAIMPSQIITAQVQDIPDLLAVRALLQHHQIRHLPLVTAQNQVVGTITHDNLSRLLNPVDLLQLQRVEDVMATEVIWAPPQTSLQHLSQRLAAHQVSCIVIGVATEPSMPPHPLGIVTERDIIRLWSQRQSFEQVQAETIMSTPLEGVLPTTSLWQAHALMQRKRIRRLVVLDEGDRLCGIVTQTSLLRKVDATETHQTLEGLTHIIDEHTAVLAQTNQRLKHQIQDRKRAKAALQYQLARERLVGRITRRIRHFLDLATVLDTAVTEVSAFLQADLTLIYRVTPASSVGTIVADKVLADHSPIGSHGALEASLTQLDLSFYTSGRIHSVPDLQGLDRSALKAQCLRELGIRATLIAPIYISNSLWGLLIVNHHTPRRWEKLEVNLLQQIVDQVGLAIQQATLHAQVEAANRQLQAQALMDGLTQIANRRCFDETLRQEWRRLAREQQPLSLILCDVDYFKRYNDTYGHPAGDACLVTVAEALTQAIRRPADQVARYGGEEFVMLLPNTTLAGACCLAEKARLALASRQLRHEASEVSDWVTLSLGVASIVPRHQASPAGLIKAADQALYQSKTNGRNRWSANEPTASAEV